MEESDRTAIASPVQGLLVYQTNNEDGFYYFNGTIWSRLISSSEFISESGVVHNTTDIARDDFVFGSTQLNNMSGASDDYRMFFDKGKGAFRVGYNDNTDWDNTNLGSFSMAMGRDNLATSSYAIALGYDNTVSGTAATVSGTAYTATVEDYTIRIVNGTPSIDLPAPAATNKSKIYILIAKNDIVGSVSILSGGSVLNITDDSISGANTFNTLIASDRYTIQSTGTEYIVISH